MQTEPQQMATKKPESHAIQIGGGVVLAALPYLLGGLWLLSRAYPGPSERLLGSLEIVIWTVALAFVFHIAAAAVLAAKKRKFAALGVWLIYVAVLPALLYGLHAMRQLLVS